MKQLVTEGIILARINYGEADRILTLLTPDQGKLRLMAKGVRRVKSKLAGGIELFSVSTITFIRGKSELGTLVSTRLIKHYGHIVGNLERTMSGYELIKQLNKITEDEVEAEYFELLKQAFEALDDNTIPLPVIRFWFAARLLSQTGHMPNLQTDVRGGKLRAAQAYNFSIESMSFDPSDKGRFNANHIKFLRLAFSGSTAKMLAHIEDSDAMLATLLPLLQAMQRNVHG